MSVIVKKTELAGVTVCVRIRPRNSAEKEADMAVVMRMEVSSVLLTFELYCYDYTI